MCKILSIKKGKAISLFETPQCATFVNIWQDDIPPSKFKNSTPSSALNSWIPWNVIKILSLAWFEGGEWHKMKLNHLHGVRLKNTNWFQVVKTTHFPPCEQWTVNGGAPGPFQKKTILLWSLDSNGMCKSAGLILF